MHKVIILAGIIKALHLWSKLTHTNLKRPITFKDQGPKKFQRMFISPKLKYKAKYSYSFILQIKNNHN